MADHHSVGLIGNFAQTLIHRKYEMKRLTIVVGLIALLTVLACGSSSISVTPSTVSDGLESEIQPATIQSHIGASRDNPAPVGAVLTVADVSLLIDKVDRPADTVVSQGNMFNQTPGANEEYMLLHVSLTCNKASSEKCSLFPTQEVNLVGSDGVVIDQAYAIAGVPDLLEPSVGLFGGASISGAIVFLVPEDETLLVILQPVAGLGKEGYLTLP